MFRSKLLKNAFVSRTRPRTNDDAGIGHQYRSPEKKKQTKKTTHLVTVVFGRVTLFISFITYQYHHHWGYHIQYIHL